MGFAFPHQDVRLVSFVMLRIAVCIPVLDEFNVILNQVISDRCCCQLMWFEV